MIKIILILQFLGRKQFCLAKIVLLLSFVCFVYNIVNLCSNAGIFYFPLLFFFLGGGEWNKEKLELTSFWKKISVWVFSTLIFLYNTGDSLEEFVVYLMPPDKSVGIGLRVLVCVFQLHILTIDVRRSATIIRLQTKRLWSLCFIQWCCS